ncbi:hypothetical protein KJ763_00230 [Patescibacteria group bacterium]|nr:hypothetical protein [Patescibacteria group bacterium]
MKKVVSWKFLIPSAVFILFITSVVVKGVVSIFLEILAVLFIIIGFIDLIHAIIKRYKRNRYIKLSVKKRLAELNLDQNKNYNEYYRILKEEEEKYKNVPF